MRCNEIISGGEHCRGKEPFAAGPELTDRPVCCWDPKEFLPENTADRRGMGVFSRRLSGPDYAGRRKKLLRRSTFAVSVIHSAEFVKSAVPLNAGVDRLDTCRVGLGVEAKTRIPSRVYILMHITPVKTSLTAGWGVRHVTYAR